MEDTVASADNAGNQTEEKKKAEEAAAAAAAAAAETAAAKEDAVFTEELADGLTKEQFLEMRKKMNVAFTQKAQKAAAFEKKAEALDKLLSNPRFIEWANAEIRREQGLAPDDENKVPDDDEELTDEQRRLDEIEHRQFLADARAELRELAATEEYKDIMDYRKEMLPFVAKGLGYRDAYACAKFPSVAKAAKAAEDAAKAAELERKKRQNLSSTRGGSSDNKTEQKLDKKSKMTVREAIISAKQKLDEGT